MSSATFHQSADLEPERPTLIEGLPGQGMVAAIAVDHITDQLGLVRHGTIRSDAFPPVVSFSDGYVQDSVRVYAGVAPDVMTLQSDVPIPESAFDGLSQCVLADLADSFERAVFLAGAPARSEDQLGTVTGIATNEDQRGELEDAGIDVAQRDGAVGGVTGALVSACHRADVPAALLLVRTDPRLPDPGSARSVIEDALEPLVEFDIQTGALQEQAEEIQEQKRRLVQQLQAGEDDEPVQSESMFQ